MKKTLVAALVAAALLGGCVTPGMKQACYEEQARINSQTGCKCTWDGKWVDAYGRTTWVDKNYVLPFMCEPAE